MENCKSNNRRGWLRSYMFGKKKRHSSQRRNEGRVSLRTKQDEAVQTNIAVDSKAEEHRYTNQTMGNVREDRRRGECPGKILPMKRRGCGFHLYFCVDNIRKSDLIKNKKTKKLEFRNEKHGESSKSIEIDERCKHIGCHDNKTEHPVINETSTQTIPNSNNPKNIVRNRNTTPVVRQKQINEDNSQTSLSETKDSEKHNHGKLEGPTKTVKRPSILRRPSNTEQGQKIRFSSTELLINIQDKEVERRSPKLAKDTNIRRGSKPESPEDEAIIKEREAFQNYANRRKSSAQGRPYIGKSVISIRRGKTMDMGSFDGFMMSQIMSKLNSIEDKIMELEKAGEDTRGGRGIKNILGITCHKTKSNGCFEMEVDDSSKQKSPADPSQGNGTIVIKVCGDDVEVRSHDRGYTNVNKRTNEGGAQQLYYNTLELDAQRIASESPSKLKADTAQDEHVKTASVSNDHSGNPTISKTPETWRRISDELKA